MAWISGFRCRRNSGGRTTQNASGSKASHQSRGRDGGKEKKGWDNQTTGNTKKDLAAARAERKEGIEGTFSNTLRWKRRKKKPAK